MKAFRIDPIQQRAFVVIADENQDLSKLAQQPLCFSPVSFTIKEVPASSIKENDKIILLDSGLSAKQITKGHALDILVSRSQTDAQYLEGCVTGLVEAMEEVGMAPPAFIQLNSQHEALRMLSSFSGHLESEALDRLRELIETGRLYNMKIGGIEFRWGPPQAQEGRLLQMDRCLAA